MARFSRFRPQRAQRADRGPASGQPTGQAAQDRQSQTAQVEQDMAAETAEETDGRGEWQLRATAALAASDRLIAAQAQHQQVRELIQAAWSAEHAAYDRDVHTEAGEALQAAGRAEFLAWQEMVVAKVKFQTARPDADRAAWPSPENQNADPHGGAELAPDPDPEAHLEAEP